MNTNELCDYYPNLLILQYRGKPKAWAEVRAMAATMNMLQDTTQDVVFSPLPISGEIVLGYRGEETAPILWSDEAPAIQSKLRAVNGLGQVVVSGSVVSGKLTVTFTGVLPPAPLLYVFSNSLEDADNKPSVATITETDVILPIAVQNGYNLKRTPYAFGKQLEVIAKYLGVGRTGVGVRGPFTLNDAGLLRLVQIATARNTLTSGMGAIANFLATQFPSQVVVTDNYGTNPMSMLLEVSTVLRESALWQAVVYYGLLPRPMGVELFFDDLAPVFGEFFGFRTYEDANPNVYPMNYYADWDYAGNFFTYEDG